MIAVWRDGELITAAAGLANLNTGVPMTVDTAFLTGSITKVWATTMFMTFVEEGLLDLDVPIVSYALVSTPTYGLVTTPTTSGTLTYTPLSSFSGTDGFKYTATNVLGQTSAPATVTLNVTSPSPTPTSARTVQSKHIQR